MGWGNYLTYICKILVIMHKILIVDDERPARDWLTGLVAFYIPNAAVTQAENAFMALEILQTENYDLLFVDISMPGMTGLELLEEINRTGKQPYAFIITAHQKYEYAVKGLRLGILDYIEKPLHKAKIRKAAKSYLDKMQSDTLDLKVYNGIRRIPVRSVIAIETADRGKVKVYTADSILPDVTGLLSQFDKQLPSNFCYIRRDCIINLHEIVRYNFKWRALEIFVVCQNEEIMFKATRKGLKNLPDQFISLFVGTDEE